MNDYHDWPLAPLIDSYLDCGVLSSLQSSLRGRHQCPSGLPSTSPRFHFLLTLRHLQKNGDPKNIKCESLWGRESHQIDLRIHLWNYSVDEPPGGQDTQWRSRCVNHGRPPLFSCRVNLSLNIVALVKGSTLHNGPLMLSNNECLHVLNELYILHMHEDLNMKRQRSHVKRFSNMFW